MKSKLSLLFLFSIAFFFSQTNLNDHISGFNMVSFTYKHDKKWSVYLETQERQIEDFSKIDYYELKGGVGYNFNKNNQAFIGVGRYGTYKNSQFYQREYRLWLQYILSLNIDKLRIDNRIRLEKRFFYFPLTDTNTDDERIRLRTALTLPLNNDKVKAKTFFINVFGEVFFAPKEPNFKRNRIFEGFGYQFNDYVSANLGYLWQRDFSVTANRNLHFLYFGLNFTFDRLKYYESHKINVAD